MKKKLTKDQLAKLTKEEKLRLIDTIEAKKRALVRRRDTFVPNSGQREVMASTAALRAVFAGNGCWGKGTEFRMADGSVRKIEDIRVGDKMMGPDGTPRVVRRLWRGREKLYLVKSRGESPIIVNESHELAVAVRRQRDYKSELVYETHKIKSLLESNKSFWRYRPKDGIEYVEKELPIEPYILGLWLGDGHSDRAAITTEDAEIAKAWADHNPESEFSIRSSGDNSKTYTVIGKPNKFLDIIKGIKLRNNKHIPTVYLLGSKKQRLELLAGLLDTDGYLNKTANVHTFINSNRILIKQVRELANSLGFRVSESSQEKGNSKWYKLCITGRNWEIPCKIPRKQASNKERKNAYWICSTTITEAGEGEFYGVLVDKDNLVVHKDYIVDKNSGKTSLGVNLTLWACLGYNSVTDTYTKVPVRGIVVLDKPEKVDQTWLPELRKWYDIDNECVLSKRGKPYITHIQFPNGSEIIFMFADQEPMSFESIELDFAVFDEPMKRSVYIALRRGARKKGSKPFFVIIGTPIAASWLRREIYDPWARGELKDTECFRFSTEVNVENLAEGYIEQFSSVLSEKEKRIRLHGEFFDLEGLALAHLFDPKHHVIEPFPWPNNWPVIIGIDPHPSKDHVACMVGVGKDGYLYYLKGLKSRSAPREFAYELKEWYQGYRVQEIICDSLGNTPGSGGDGNMTFIGKLNSCGVRARSTSFKDKSDEDFIQRIQQVLEIPKEANNFGQIKSKLRIFEGNRDFVHEIENVQWTKYRGEDIYKPKLDISNKDLLAAFKYALTAAGTVTHGKPKVKRTKARSPWSAPKKKKNMLY